MTTPGPTEQHDAAKLFARGPGPNVKHLGPAVILDWTPSIRYRGLHLVHSYHSDRTDTYNDLRIETKVRSRLRHAWATAVEAVGFSPGRR